MLLKVNLHMLVHITPLGEARITYVANVRLLASVDSQMVEQAASLFEALVAVWFVTSEFERYSGC